MKNQYTTPEINVQNIEVCNVIASSINYTNIDLENGGYTESSGIITGNAKNTTNFIMKRKTSPGQTVFGNAHITVYSQPTEMH